MDKDKKFFTFKDSDGLVKKLFLTIGLAIALFILMLFSSGIFFTGAVVQGMNETATSNSHK
ncbi:MAG: hypothetical protein PHG00_08640 [Methylococcales bacterium]|nr:hypothetical protein [Methylococcales bacterium]